MTATRFARSTLIALLATAFVWHSATGAGRSDLFGISATIASSHVELRVKLPALCLRLTATLSGLLDASAQLLSCDGCTGRPRARLWS